MTARRPRGRPVTFDAHRRTLYLEALTGGATLTAAAARAGITARRAAQVADTDPAFAHARATARAAGKRVRAELMPHGEVRYNKLGCRCTICTKDATANRTARRNRNTHTPDTTSGPAPATIAPMPNPPARLGNPFPLARAS